MAVALITTSIAKAADITAGKEVFKAQCILCHSAEPDDNGGAQGPDLHDVFGRQSGTTNFGYTDALVKAKLTWDQPTLDRFLSSPGSVVPGTAMVIAVPDKKQRTDLIAYLQSVKDKKSNESSSSPQHPSSQTVQSATVMNDWKDDKPGRIHHVDVAHLPQPLDTPSAARSPRVVPKPENAELHVPEGFKVNVFTTEVKAPRVMKLAPNGDIILSEPQAGKVMVLRPSADDSIAGTVSTFAEGLKQPFGIAFYPDAIHPQFIYVAETNRVVRYRYDTGDLKARSALEVVIPRLHPREGGHYTRDVAFSPDARRMFVSVGSMSNVAEDMPRKSASEIRKWEATHARGSAWADEEDRADVLVYDMNAGHPGPAKIFATGIRNCVGLTVQPASGDLWCTTNERDLLGNELVPDYSTRVNQGAFYGWPWYYLGDHEDPRHAGERPDLKGHIVVPDILYQSHSAPLNMIFYPANKGIAAFPEEYVGDGFTTMHGSWNRAMRTGHKIVRVPMKNGKPTGDYEDFLTGFIIDDDHVWGRPVGLVVAADGSLLMSDDGNDTIYRISYSRHH